MFWQKLRHHVSFIFIAILVTAQALIFIVGKATPHKNYDLAAVFIEPVAQSTLALGEAISLRAQFPGKNFDDRVIVYLVVASPEKNIHLNFEASRQNDGSYLADNFWLTENWPAGIYQLSANINIFNEEGFLEDSLDSSPTLVQLIDVSSQPNPTLPSQLPVDLRPAIDDESVPPTGLDIKINTGPTSTNSNTNTNTNSNTNTNVNTNTNTNSNTNTNTNTNTSPSGDTSNNATTTQKKISLVVPTDGSMVSSQSLSIKLVTNFAADSLNIELINADSAAISTGNLSIYRVDGLNWTKTIALDDTFINGDYKLLVSAAVPGEAIVLLETFDLILALPTTIDPEEVVLTLANIDSNISGLVTLRASSNKSLDSLDFVVQNSLDRQEVLRVSASRQAANATTSQQYFYLWDTSALPDANYYVLAETKVGTTVVKSAAELATVFNGHQADSSTSTSSLSQENLPNTTSSTSTIPLSNANDIDCVKSGINDAGLCEKFKAEIGGQIPSLCLAQGIYSSSACEKYLQENQAVKECQIKNLTDASECQDYLFNTYADQVTCALTATSTCPDILRNHYLNRLFVAQKEQQTLSQVLGPNFGKVMAISELAKLISDQNLLSMSPLLVEDAPNLPIFVAQAKAVNILNSAEELIIAKPVLILLDSDSDLLPNDLEKYYGADADNPDTDGDGYTDGQEVKSGYNPTGEGKLLVDRSSLDQALFAGLPLEQPLSFSALLDPDWQVKQAETKNGQLLIAGQADPDTWVNLYLYSDLPILFSTKTDSSGVWSYTFNQPLTEGLHKVYVANNDNNGKLLKQSDSISFVVTNISNSTGSVPAAPIQEKTENKSFWQNLPFNVYYIAGGVFLILFVLGIILLIRRSRAIAQSEAIEESLPLDSEQIPKI